MQVISARQLVLIGTIFTLSSTLISVQSQMIPHAKQHIWLSHLLGMVVIAISMWLLARTLSRFPDHDLFQALLARFPSLGKVAIALYVLFFFFILTRDIRMLIDFVNVALLPTTPMLALAILTMFTVCVSARGGIEVMGRVTELYGPLLIAMLFFLPLLLFREFDTANIMPFWRLDVPGVSRGAWYILPYLGEAIVMPMIFMGRTFRFRHGLIALGLGTFVLIALAMQAMLALGQPIMERMLYPNYELVRQLRITDFLDRFDLPMVGVWLPTMLAKITINLYVVCYGLRRMIPGLWGAAMVNPVGFLAMVCSIWFFEDAIQLYELNRVWPTLALCFELLLPILFYLILRPKKQAIQKT
ncbi:GerAB/ArcD/ProY family transporter [Paenibacillus xerothermodurans]|uniref:Spore gernimation protein n=1 Tax=Paenibacillus xerothermodurans TaxID=1977292 RepID=A0A2W1NE27_PAEXE|nr:endospore germination permease [Paenibacillus xerothermodurans]PZE21381.1 spore gernimation protein [Paenibacillus xerothermodurans]